MIIDPGGMTFEDAREVITHDYCANGPSAALVYAAHRALAEVDRLRAALAEHRRRSTRAGIPPGYHLPGAWTNGTHSPPPSASDPTAPPLRRRLV